jgi:hypothetical protein
VEWEVKVGKEKLRSIVESVLPFLAILGATVLFAMPAAMAEFIASHPYTFGAICSCALAVIAYVMQERIKARQKEARQRIERIEIKAEKEPEKVKFAWELASAKLEAYFDRNLSQVFAIFMVAIFVMLIGFGFVLWGVSLAIRHPGQNTAWIAAISGIITEFIGVTFMVIYRSTMSQANSFMQVLERINTVGMAVQILDSIPEADAQLKNTTRAELVRLLFKSAAEVQK